MKMPRVLKAHMLLLPAVLSLVLLTMFGTAKGIVGSFSYC